MDSLSSTSPLLIHASKAIFYGQHSELIVKNVRGNKDRNHVITRTDADLCYRWTTVTSDLVNNKNREAKFECSLVHAF